MNRHTVMIKWSYQWLQDRSSSVECPRITPGFQIMRFRDVPIALRRGLVIVHAEMNAHLCLSKLLSKFDMKRSKIDIKRSGINRISFKDHQQVNLPGIEIVHERFQ